MIDLAIRGATVVDGTGSAPRVADVGVDGGRVVAVGSVPDSARRTVDASGLLLAPGFIDPHTHYDAQLFWDPMASPSTSHGVTTVVAGNCGFTLAPLDPGDADYLRRMMAKVEGMPLAALEQGVPWSWRSFGEYLGQLEGRIAVNAGFLVGHCALRRTVLGADGRDRVATASEVVAMAELLAQSLAAGGLGFSSSQSRTHTDGDGAPITSRAADRVELLALCAEVARHPGTTVEYITNGCLDTFSDDEIDLMATMSRTARRPLNWNVLTIEPGSDDKVARQLHASTVARRTGGRIVALTMPTLVPMNMSFRTHCALFLIPGWADVMGLPEAQRIDALRDPAVRRRLDELAHAESAGVFRRLAGWSRYVIGDTFSEKTADARGKSVAELVDARRAQGLAADPFDVLLDVVCDDELRTVLWPIPPDFDDGAWPQRAAIWRDERVLLGGSDAGAHLDRMCGASYPTAFLADCLRGRQLVPVEEAVAMLTSAPADLFGLAGRGRITPGAHADLVLLDPETVGSGPARLTDDLPGSSARLVADAFGVVEVVVGGTTVVRDGEPTGALPGTVLRSGRDTVTVDPTVAATAAP
jgi:N-acyl-D-aspartate/D-glutamate deacylase